MNQTTGSAWPADGAGLPKTNLEKPGKVDGLWDWPALKMEWLASNESLNAFRVRKDIRNIGDFYQRVEADSWVDAKEEIRSRAAARVENSLVKDTAKRWGDYRKLFEASKAQVAQIFNSTVKDGKIVRPMTPLELAQLVGAVDRMLKAESFMDGGPSERIETRNINLDMVDLIEKIERGEI